MKKVTENDIDFICSIDAPCFHSLSLDEIASIQESKTQILFRKGENLTKQGTYASYILFIIKGIVKQHLEEKDKNYNIQILTNGDFIGLNTLFNKDTYNCSTIALDDTQVLLIDKKNLTDIIYNNGTFSYNLIHNHCKQNELLYDAVKNLMYKQMNGRLATALLYLSDDKFMPFNVFNLLTRKDIAEFAGISTESTVKLLKSLEKDGILKLQDKDIVIVEREVLVDIAEKG